MWTLSTNDNIIRAELDARGRHIRTLKEASAAALLLIIGFTIITLPDEILNRSDQISPLGRLAWHSFLGVMAGIIVVFTRWNRQSSWVAQPEGIWFGESVHQSPDVKRSNIRSLKLQDKAFRSRRLVVEMHDGKSVVLCRGFRSGQSPEDMLEKMTQWYQLDDAS